MSFAEPVYLPFLLLTLALFQFVPARARKGFLLAASLVFYLWWQAADLLLLLASIGVGWFGACWIEGRRAKRFALWVVAVLLLAPLVVFKYTGLFEHALPIGLSFYTFQALGYVIDVARGRRKATRDPIGYGLYVSFFPQLVAGPIERAGHLMPQLDALRTLNSKDASLGARRILWGLLKKGVVADRLRAFLWPVFENPEQHGSLALWLTTFGLNALLYLDFSAYTDIARGSARLFGVELVENFKRPFLSTSLAEYAQRWHVSLYTWIRDYLFSPVSRGPLSHAAIWRTNLFVMTLFGLWHGAGWTFVFWGMFSGVAIALQHSRRLSQTRRGVRRDAPSTMRRAGRIFWTLSVSSLFFVLFFAQDLAAAGDFYERLVSFRAAPSGETLDYCLPLAGLLFTLWTVHAAGAWIALEQLWQRLGPLVQGACFLLAAGIWVIWRVRDALPFIYFAF